MAKKNDVDLLLSKLDKMQLEDFIREECGTDVNLRARFLALGVGTLFSPDSEFYASRVVNLMSDYEGRYGYIEYRSTFDFNHDVSRILAEADEAMCNCQWKVAVAVLSGVASVAESILNSGDDSAGELSGIVSECFDKWHELCREKSLPEHIKSEIFELALSMFNDKYLKGWDWWWDWMQMAIDLADTTEKQGRVFAALDALEYKGDDWSLKYTADTAQKYKLEMMSRSGSEEEQVKFMYENVANPDFRKRLIQLLWDKSDYTEVLRLAKDGAVHDSRYVGLVNNWNQWQYKVYQEIGDKANALQLARYLFFQGARWGDREFSMESMYAALRSLVSKNEWPKYVETLINEAIVKEETGRLIFIYTEEQMWDKYMDYLRKQPDTFAIDQAPDELKNLYRDEIVRLYSAAVKEFFQQANNRKSYSEGVSLLRQLIAYGGRKEAEQIVAEQKSRTPRRPALIDELSNL